MRIIAAFAFVALGLSASTARADKVTVRGAHLCCGACVAGAQEALDGIKGVSKVTCDVNSKTINFLATDEAAAKAGIAGLAKGGFYGDVAHGNKILKFPDAGAKKGDRTNKIKFHGLHLCCGACVTGAQKAVQSVPGLKAIDIDRKEGTMTLSGASLVVTDALKALNKGGFYGKIKTEKEETK